MSAYLDILLSYLDVGYLAHLYGIEPPDIWMSAYLDILLSSYLDVALQLDLVTSVAQDDPGSLTMDWE